jgi:hypothetical protein
LLGSLGNDWFDIGGLFSWLVGENTINGILLLLLDRGKRDAALVRSQVNVRLNARGLFRHSLLDAEDRQNFLRCGAALLGEFLRLTKERALGKLIQRETFRTYLPANRLVTQTCEFIPARHARIIHSGDRRNLLVEIIAHAE